MKKITIIYLIFVFVLFGQTENYKTQEFGQPFITYYSPKEYNGGRQNWSIIQNKQGIVYAGNQYGVLEFDGNNWSKINVPNNEAVRAMDVDENNKIYLTAGADFGYLETDLLGRLNYKSLLPFLDKGIKNIGEFWDVAASTHGIYFKTRDRILKWDGVNITVWDSIFAFRLYNINDKIYSRNDGVGLMVIDGDSLKLMPDGEYFESIGVFNLLPYKKKTENGIQQILITTNDDGLFLHDGNKFSPFKTEADSFLKSRQIYNACVMAEGDFAFSTQRGGVAIMDQQGKFINIINKNSNLPTDVVYDVFPGINGGLWFATLNGIAYCELPSSFSIYKDKGLQEEMTYSVLRFNDIIYTTNELGVFYLSEESSTFKIVSGSQKPAYSLLNSEGSLLASTNRGVALIENNKYKKELDIDASLGIINSKIFPGRIYIGSGTGFAIIQNENNDINIKFQKYLIDGVTIIVESNDGSLWLAGYFDGLYHVTGKMDELGNGSESNVNFKFYDGSDKNILPASIENIFEIQGKPIFSTDKGLFYFDKNKQQFLPDSTFGNYFVNSTNVISLIRKNKNGDLWILSSSDDQNNLGKAFLENDGTYKWEPNNDFKRLDLNSISDIFPEFDENTQRENFWISSEEGLIKYSPVHQKETTEDFKTIISKITIKNDSLIYRGKDISNINSRKVVLPFSKNDISFEFSAVYFEKPEEIKYQYYLEGNDNSWSQWSNETKKEYTNLSQGKYKFHIRSQNIYGSVSEGDTFAFRVLAPWYFTYWAFGFYFVIFTAGVFTTDRIMRSRVLKKEREQNLLREAEFRAQAAELQAKAAETQSRFIQAENDRKTQELEEARQLQLSMLPNEIPDVSNLEISVYMKTATEVGGDYYDFSKNEDDSINIVIGDATGHGMKAGIMVSIMKTLFKTESTKLNISDFFRTSNKSIKELNLERIMMTFSMLNINGNKISYANAGMPSIFMFKKENKSVEEIELNNMPLGAMLLSKYEIKTFDVNPGDSFLMFSDGLPELFNSNKEMFGFERIKNEFAIIAENHPEEIVNHFKKIASEWMFEAEQEDDLTFMVIRVK